MSIALAVIPYRRSAAETNPDGKINVLEQDVTIA
jgi:hypothetical protein